MTRYAELDESLLQAVDDGLLTLGKIARAAIYERVHASYQVKHEEIPEKLLIFHKALQDLLGSGAKTVEKLIAKNLYNRLGLKFTQHDSWTLIDYANHARTVERHA